MISAPFLSCCPAKVTLAGANPQYADATAGFPQRVTPLAASLETLQKGYTDCWSGLDKRFNNAQ
jgi:hypothetical protein